MSASTTAPDSLALAGVTPRRSAVDAQLARFGDVLRRYGWIIRSVQWLIVAVYAVLVIVPALLPLPDNAAHIWTNLTLAAQFAFWGIWWPFVLVSMVLVGRAWCGVPWTASACSAGASSRPR